MKNLKNTPPPFKNQKGKLEERETNPKKITTNMITTREKENYV